MLETHTQHVHGQWVGQSEHEVDVIDSYGMFLLVRNALREGKSLSIVRMSDGEQQILEFCRKQAANFPMLQFTQRWREDYGVEGITCGEMDSRLTRAATECSYFAPDGWKDELHDVNFLSKYFLFRLPFAHIYYHHEWTPLMKKELFNLAGSVLVINRNATICNKIKFAKINPLKDIEFISLSKWEEADSVIARAESSQCPLVLVSAGPGSKYIIPEIANQGKVVLDVGSGMDKWWDDAR